MSQFERFATEGTEKADEWAIVGAMLDVRERGALPNEEGDAIGEYKELVRRRWERERGKNGGTEQ